MMNSLLKVDIRNIFDVALCTGASRNKLMYRGNELLNIFMRKLQNIGYCILIICIFCVSFNIFKFEAYFN